MTARVLVLDWPAADAPMLEWAIAYGRAGLRVLPLQPRSKVPATLHGVHDATSDLDQIRAWWTATPNASIGVACGAGLMVLDLDGRHGGHASFDRLMAEHRLPAAPFVVTGSGDGVHVYLHDPNGRVRSASGGTPERPGTLGAGIDVQAEGRYVVAPPSIHPSGGIYQWSKSARLGIPDLPQSLVDVLAPAPPVAPATPAPTRPAPRASTRGGLRAVYELPTPYGRAALDAILPEIAAAPEGARHDAIYRAAARCGDLARDGHVDAGETYDLLLDAGRAVVGDPRRDAEIARAIRDAMLAARGTGGRHANG